MGHWAVFQKRKRVAVPVPCIPVTPPPAPAGVWCCWLFAHAASRVPQRISPAFNEPSVLPSIQSSSLSNSYLIISLPLPLQRQYPHTLFAVTSPLCSPGNQQPWEPPKRLIQIRVSHPSPLAQHLPLPCHFVLHCTAPQPRRAVGIFGDAAAEQPIREIGARTLEERRQPSRPNLYRQHLTGLSSLPPSYTSPSIATVLRLLCLPRNAPRPILDSSLDRHHRSAFSAPLRKTTNNPPPPTNTQ